MAKYLNYNGNPNGKVFGRIGDIVVMDDGSSYYKQSYDAMNVGWVTYPLVTATPVPTPTPSPTPIHQYVPPTPTPTYTPTPTPSPSPFPTPTPTPTPTAGPAPTATPAPTPPPASTYTLSVNTSAHISTTGSGTYSTGSIVGISATPLYGYAFSEWSDLGTGYLLLGGSNARYTNPNAVQIPSHPYADPIVITATAAATISPTVTNTINGNNTGPMYFGTSTTTTLASVMTDYTHTMTEVTMSLSGSESRTWTYMGPFIYDNSHQVAKSENFTFNTAGTYVFSTTARNSYGVTTATPITVYVTGTSAMTYTSMSVTGSTANGAANVIVAGVTVTGVNANLSIDFSWTRPASVSDPVYLNEPSLTLTNGETSYSHTGLYSVGGYTPFFYRNSADLDTVKISVVKTGGNGILVGASARGLTFSGNDLKMRVDGVSGTYHYNVRNCTTGTSNSSSNLSYASQNTVATSTSPSIALIELVNYTDGFSSPTLSPTPAYIIYPISDDNGDCAFTFVNSSFQNVFFSISGQPWNSRLDSYAVCGYGVTSQLPRKGSYQITTIPCL